MVSTGDPKDLHMTVWSVPGSDQVEIYLTGPRVPRTADQVSDASLRLNPAGDALPAKVFWDAPVWRGFLHLILKKGHVFIDDFAHSRELAASQSNQNVSIAYGGADDAMRQFRECLNTHEREWGGDPNADAALLVRPEEVGGWMSNLDYPADAIDKTQSGIVVVRLATDVTGKVIGCAVVQSIATKSMEDITCRQAVRRGRYTVAVGADGRPTPTSFITYVNFRIWSG